MKKTLLLLFFIIASGCAKHIEYSKVPKSVANELKSTLHDPSSFEFVNSHRIELYGPIMGLYMTNRDKELKYLAFDKPYLRKELDKIFHKDSVYGYHYELNFRAKNSFGALVKNSMTFTLTNYDFSVGYVDDESKAIESLYKIAVSSKVDALRNKLFNN